MWFEIAILITLNNVSMLLFYYILNNRSSKVADRDYDHHNQSLDKFDETITRQVSKLEERLTKLFDIVQKDQVHLMTILNTIQQNNGDGEDLIDINDVLSESGSGSDADDIFNESEDQTDDSESEEKTDSSDEEIPLTKSVDEKKKPPVNWCDLTRSCKVKKSEGKEECVKNDSQTDSITNLLKTIVVAVENVKQTISTSDRDEISTPIIDMIKQFTKAQTPPTNSKNLEKEVTSALNDLEK